MEDKSTDYSTLDLETLLKLLTAVIRNDKYSEGYLVNCFENGILLNILKSLSIKSLNMKKIFPKNVLYIKLGKGGGFSEDCITNNYIKLGYDTVDHKLCERKDWKAVNEYFISEEKATKSVATSHTNQIKYFYEEDENTLWITFHNNKLWWCFSNKDIKLLEDKTKIRSVIGKWSDKDIKNNILFSSNLSGKLLKTHGFQGTICNVDAHDYAVVKINGEQRQEVVDVEKAKNDLIRKLTLLIQHLQWQDFEILIDLIFRQMGWQRVSVLGKDMKTLDIELLSPVSQERAIVQIKQEADVNEFEKYHEKFIQMDYDKYFFVVGSPKQNLNNYEYNNNENKIKLYRGEDISELTVSSGLIDWIIRKST